MGVETDSGRAAVAFSHRAISPGPLVTVKKEISLFFFSFNFHKLKLQNIPYRDLKTSLLGLFVRNKNGDLMSTLSKELTFENGVMFALCRKGQIRQKWFLSTDLKSNAKLKMTGL